MSLSSRIPFAPRCSLPLIAVQPLSSTVPCKCLYSLANSALPFAMFSSPNPPICCRNRSEQSFSFTSSPSFTSSTSISPLAQTLPTFPTPSKHPAHSNARNSIPFTHLLHASLDARGVGSYRLPATTHISKIHVCLPAARKVGYNLRAPTADLCRRGRILCGRLS
jgi:hypothetical protein